MPNAEFGQRFLAQVDHAVDRAFRVEPQAVTSGEFRVELHRGFLPPTQIEGMPDDSVVHIHPKDSNFLIARFKAIKPPKEFQQTLSAVF